MTQMLARGQKVALAALSLTSEVVLAVRLDGVDVDVSCFGLDADRRLSDDRWLVFFNQPSSPDGSIVLDGDGDGDGGTADGHTFRVRLDRVPAQIDRLVLVASVDGSGTMGQLRSGHVRVSDGGGTEVARHEIDSGAFTTEAAVMVAELYRRDGWRLGIIGQGFAGGLDAVVRQFGGEVADGPARAGDPPPPPVATRPEPPSPPPEPITAPVPIPPTQPTPVVTAPPPPLPPPPATPAPAPAATGLFATGPLAGYAEPQVPQRFVVHHRKMLKVTLAAGELEEVFARQGAMVAYQGDVDFDHKGSGLKRYLKSKVTGEALPLMSVSGRGDVFFADRATHVYVLELEGDGLSLNGRNVLAFEPSLEWDIRKVEGVGFLSSGTGFFNVVVHGHGRVAITSDGPPVALAAPVRADPSAIVGWTAGLRIRPHRSAGLKALVGRGSGEVMQLAFTGEGHVIVQPSEV